MLRKLISRARDKLIDSVLYLVQRGPNPVTHKIEKAKLLKKVFWHINIERLHGEYFEFRVAFRNSIQSLVLASKFARPAFSEWDLRVGNFSGLTRSNLSKVMTLEVNMKLGLEINFLLILTPCLADLLVTRK